VTNLGPSNVAGVVVKDNFPSTFTGVTFTATQVGGVSGFTATGAGNIQDVVTMPTGSVIHYIAAGRVSPAATDTISNTASATVPSGTADPNLANNSATDIDTISFNADLKITVTDGKTVALAGSKDTYTIVVSNGGPSNITGAVIQDNFPTAFTGVNFTATQMGGASGFTGLGSGNINDTVTLPSGSRITYKAIGTISSSTGSISDTATVSTPAGVTDPNIANNRATDTDSLSAQADLKVTVSDGKSAAIVGGKDTYTIVVSNNSGPSTAIGALVSDNFPATFAGVTYTATQIGGASGFTGLGSGNIGDIVTLPSGSSITYKATGTISSSANGSISNTATISAPAGVTDPNTANNSATDTDTL
jgi:uncharacterized repeat protein (TIGR01451 family)